MRHHMPERTFFTGYDKKRRKLPNIKHISTRLYVVLVDLLHLNLIVILVVVD